MASMDKIYQGAAIFSTRLGKFKPRITVPPSIILRTDPEDDQDEMVARLQRTFPQECKLIKAPIIDVAYYFDVYDMHHYGYRFLESVLATIARHNWIRAQNIQGFADQWRKANPGRFDGIMSMSYEVFRETARHTHGEGFKREVFGLLQSHRAYQSVPIGPQTHQPLYQSQPYGATPRSSLSNVTLPPSSNPSRSQGDTSSFQGRTHESSPQSSSSRATLQPDPAPNKSRAENPSYRSHTNRTSPESSSSRATLQSGLDPRKSQANTSSSQSPENGSSSYSSSSHATLQSGPNQRKFRANNSSQTHANRNSSKFSSNHGTARSGPNQRKSLVNNGPSRTNADGNLPSHTHESFQNHAHGASQDFGHGASQGFAHGTSQGFAHGTSQGFAHGTSQGFAHGTSQGFAHETSQSHEYRGPQPCAQESYQQQPSDFMAFQSDSYGRPPVLQNFQFGPRRMPVRGYIPSLRGYYSDPESYIQRHQTQYVGPIVYDYSPEQESPLSYLYPSPSSSQSYMAAPNPLKTVTDDARKLEEQEAADRSILHDSNNLSGLQRQPSEKAVGKLPDPELYGSALSDSNFHISGEQPANYLLDRDPAVISVGSKPDRALDQSDQHSADVHQSPQDEKGGFLASLMQKHQSSAQQPSIPPVSEKIEDDSLTELHDTNAHQMYHQSKNIKTLPGAREPLTHGNQSESRESSGLREEEPFDRQMTSNGQQHAIVQPQPIHGRFMSSNTHSTSSQGNSYGNRPDTSNSNVKATVWVGGLDPKITEAKLMEIFGPYGKITKISNVFARGGEMPWAFAFVTFLTEEAADRAVNGLSFRMYDDMPLKVRPAERPRRYGDTSHRIASDGSNFQSPNQDRTMSLAENISPRESKSRDVASPSLGRRHGDFTGTSASGQSKRLSKSKLRNGKANETPNTISGSSSRHHHKTSVSGAQGTKAAPHSREVSQSSKSAVTMKEEIKITDHSSRLSHSSENISTAEGREIPKQFPAVNESPQEPSTVGQEVKAAKDSPRMGDSLQNSSEIEKKAVMDVSKEHRPAEPGQGSGALANAPTVDSSFQNDSQTWPRTMAETKSELATEPQANQDANASISSPAAEDNSVPSRLPHKDEWRVQKRPKKAAKHKNMSETEQQKSGAIDMGVPIELSEEGILPDIRSEENDPSVSENVAAETAQQQIQPATNLQNLLDEASQPETMGPTESSVSMQNQVPLASKSVEAPETLPMGVNETSSADWPSLPKRVEVDRTEASSVYETPAVARQTKKKKKKQKNSMTAPKDAGTACKPEPNPCVIEKATDIKTLPVQPYGECATDIKGDGDGNSGISIDEDATERKRESIEPFRTESVTPTPDHPDSAAAQPQNKQSKKTRKSKNKKGKSADESSQAPACPSEEAAEALVALSKGVTQVSAVPSEESAEAKASFKPYLPAPETPFLPVQTQNILPVDIDKKEKDQTHIAPPIDSDDKGEDQANTVVPVQSNKKRKGRKKNKSTSTVEEPHICSRKELSQYHFLKDRDYWPQLSKIIRGNSTSGLNSSTEPTPENLLHSEAEKPGVSHSEPKKSAEADSTVSMDESIEGKMVEGELEGELKGKSPAVIIRAKEFLEALGNLAVPGPETAFSEAAGPSSTPLLTPQTPCTRTGTESSSSLGTLSDDGSSESSTLQSDGDDLTDDGGEDPPTVPADKVPLSSRQCQTHLLRPSAKPSGSRLLPDLQPGDKLHIEETPHGLVFKVSQDEGEREELSNVKCEEEEEEEGERDTVERRDKAVIVESTPWGYSEKVWIP